VTKLKKVGSLGIRGGVPPEILKTPSFLMRSNGPTKHDINVLIQANALAFGNFYQIAVQRFGQAHGKFAAVIGFAMWFGDG
jgi:hypothetical protein